MTESLLFIGVLFIWIGALGILWMPNTLSRCHALSKAVTFGITSVLIALFIALPDQSHGEKAILAILFQWMTIPLSGHLIAVYIYTFERL